MLISSSFDKEIIVFVFSILEEEVLLEIGKFGSVTEFDVCKFEEIDEFGEIAVLGFSQTEFKELSS